MKTLIARLGGALFAICCLATLAFASLAQADNLSVIDKNPTSPGHVLTDASGDAYVAWTSGSGSALPDPVRFCKIPASGKCTSPVTLPIPGAVSSIESSSGAFPVFGAGSTVYVVAPRYVADDTVVWTSTDGGQTFGPGAVSTGSYPAKTDPTDVITSGGNFLIASYNAGLGFSTAPVAGGPGGNFSFADPGGGGVVGSSLALDPSGNPVEAYWNLSDPYGMFFYRYKGSGPLTTASNWTGPTAIAGGYETVLAGGPSGLFLASQDYVGGKSNPTAVRVRKFDGTTFGSAITLANDSSTDLFAGGDIAQSAGGRVGVAWPVPAKSGDLTMRLFLSTNGGASFTESDIAKTAGGYGLNDNAQLAVGDKGNGWLTFEDAGGLKLADFSPVAGKPYSGPTKETTTPAGGGNDLTLKVPKNCLGSAQPFYVGVGKKARRRVAKALRGKLDVKKVTFLFDGKKLKTLKHKPFRYLIKPGPLKAGSTHVVKSRVVAKLRKHGRTSKVHRTLKGSISIC